jgi:hypothetical protein
MVAVNRDKVFLLLSPTTHSLHVSARAGHLQVIFFSFEASYYCLLTDPIEGNNNYILYYIILYIITFLGTASVV